jgi:hypothetical protein
MSHAPHAGVLVRPASAQLASVSRVPPSAVLVGRVSAQASGRPVSVSRVPPSAVLVGRASAQASGLPVSVSRVPPSAVLAGRASAQASGQPVSVSHVPPVDEPVIDPFRPPATPYGAGNRGLEYDTRPGEPVRASAAGTVVYAGQIGGTLHVTVLHADGVHTSYSFLSRVAVVRGQHVAQGDSVGSAGDRLHFGARIGDAYFDPALLFAAAGAGTVELIPFEDPPGTSPDAVGRAGAEARALIELAFDGSGAGGIGLPSPGDVSRWLRDRAATTGHYLQQLSPTGPIARAPLELGRRLFFPGPCSDDPPPRAPVRGQHRVAITVAGLGSSTGSGSIDELRTRDLGYADGNVVKFSYAGGKAPGTGDAIDVPATPYVSADTQGDLRVAAHRLAELVADVMAADPAATVDLLAHSQGGIVTRLALLDIADWAADGTVDLDRLGLVATLGTPHRGADLATAVTGANTHLSANLALDALEATVDTGIDPDAVAVAQLAETSELIADLGRRGVPPAVHLVSIGARGDLVVAAPNTAVDGATNITLPVMGRSAHGDLVGSDAATGELARALAGEPPGCESVPDVVGDVVIGHAISAGEDATGAAIQLRAP